MASEPISFTPSRNIAGIAYDGESQTMLVSFRSGAIYRYLDVPEDVALGFSQSLSASDYLKLFVTNQFVYERIG